MQTFLLRSAKRRPLGLVAEISILESRIAPSGGIIGGVDQGIGGVNGWGGPCDSIDPETGEPTPPPPPSNLPQKP